MFVAHKLLRREFGALPELVRGVAEHDERAATVVDHVEFLLCVLHNHHGGEDHIVWPRLHERAPAEIEPLVNTMESQHADIARQLTVIEQAASRFAHQVTVTNREALAVALEGLLDPLTTHLAIEEPQVLPLIDRHLTAEEWASVSAHALTGTPPEMMAVLFGMSLRNATDVEKRLIAANVPADVFEQMSAQAPNALADYEDALYGRG